MDPTVYPRAQTSRQAKAAYAKRKGVIKYSELQMRKMAREEELHNRAMKLQAKEVKRKLNARKKAAKEAEKEEKMKQLGIPKELGPTTPSQPRLETFLRKRKRPDGDEESESPGVDGQHDKIDGPTSIPARDDQREVTSGEHPKKQRRDPPSPPLFNGAIQSTTPATPKTPIAKPRAPLGIVAGNGSKFQQRPSKPSTKIELPQIDEGLEDFLLSNSQLERELCDLDASNPRPQLPLASSPRKLTTAKSPEAASARRNAAMLAAEIADSEADEDADFDQATKLKCADSDDNDDHDNDDHDHDDDDDDHDDDHDHHDHDHHDHDHNSKEKEEKEEEEEEEEKEEEEEEWFEEAQAKRISRVQARKQMPETPPRTKDPPISSSYGEFPLRSQDLEHFCTPKSKDLAVDGTVSAHSTIRPASRVNTPNESLRERALPPLPLPQPTRSTLNVKSPAQRQRRRMRCPPPLSEPQEPAPPSSYGDGGWSDQELLALGV